MESLPKLAPQFKDGVRFECQGSGQCCMSRGTYGYVYFSAADRKRMAGVLGVSVGEFTRKHCEKTEGLYHLKYPEKDCQFLDGKRCMAYEGRPTQCRTWPFWPENMNAKIWNTEVAPFCAGVGKGKLYSPEEIKTIIDEANAGDPSRPEVEP
jgi:Fe-S-cluster containining protein